MLEQILTGDCRAILPTLEAESVQCCVTSPPYWGLRDYGTGQWEGGDVRCDHVEMVCGMSDKNTLGPNGYLPQTNAANVGRIKQYRNECICGARRIDQQLGLEATPEEYIANMVAVFRWVWRVLRDDGTLWLNLGDSYAGSTNGNTKTGLAKLADSLDGHHRDNESWQKHVDTHYGFKRPDATLSGLKPKDLCMMPARLAMALQADGWYLRSDIIWHKPNPMPESVTDRPTKAHEYIFLLTKQERYFYQAEAIREPHAFPNGHQGGYTFKTNPNNQGWNGQRSDMKGNTYNEAGRNKRSVWTIATQPYAEAHFATFPEEIPKLCILAGSKLGDTVIDPFAGSGTTGKVALELGRKAILIELNPAYIELARARTFTTPGFL